MGNFSSFSVKPMGSANAGDNSYAGRTPIPFPSKEEMVLWLKDPRYSGGIGQRDPAYVAHCEARLMLSEDNTTGANRNLSGTEHTPEYQDPLNTLGGMNDVYRDMSEARKDQAAPLYKESAFERQRVAEKIGRSVPDDAVRSGKQHASIQMMGGGGEEGESE